MQQQSALQGESLARILTVDPVDPYMGPRFKCRPLTARSAEQHTAFGFFHGQLGLSDVPEFSAALRELSSDNRVKIIVDFSGLALSKSAVGALVGFAAAMHGRNRRLYLYKTSAQIRGVLKELKLIPYFTFLESEDDIIATLVV